MKRYKNMEYRELIIQLAKLMDPASKTYVELGVQKGYTFNTVSRMFRRSFAVDIKILESIYSQPNKVYNFEMNSDQFKDYWIRNELGMIDLLFIDADHKKEKVLKDFDNLSPFVNKTGLILLHDTYPVAEFLVNDRYCSTAWQAGREIFKNKKYKEFEIVTLPFPYAGLSIIRNAEKHLHWYTTKPKERYNHLAQFEEDPRDLVIEKNKPKTGDIKDAGYYPDEGDFTNKK